MGERCFPNLAFPQNHLSSRCLYPNNWMLPLSIRAVFPSRIMNSWNVWFGLINYVVCLFVKTSVLTWKSKSILQKLVLFFHHRVLGILGGKHIYLGAILLALAHVFYGALMKAERMSGAGWLNRWGNPLWWFWEPLWCHWETEKEQVAAESSCLYYNSCLAPPKDRPPQIAPGPQISGNTFYWLCCLGRIWVCCCCLFVLLW